jgi:NAD(P) transhydrogenase subunit alpha
LASLTLLQKAEGNVVLKAIAALSLGFALYNVVGGFLVTDRMLAMFRRKGDR